MYLVDVINFAHCTNTVFKVKLNNFQGIEDRTFQAVMGYIADIIKMNVNSNSECRVCLDQEGHDGVILPSMSYTEIDGTLFRNLLVEELIHSHSFDLHMEFRLSVIHHSV